MAKTEREKEKEKQEFIEFVKNATDSELLTMLWIADNQKQHPDHANRCWAGSKHNVPFLDVYEILHKERKKRGVKYKYEPV